MLTKRRLIGMVVVALAWSSMGDARADGFERNLAGSVQLDYLAVPTQKVGRDLSLDGATVELSLKLAMDFDKHVSSNVKMCVACHGLEIGMAFFDIKVADQLNFRIGRFTPQFGNFPARHDPANHRTSDKPLPYDMGRMLRLREWNMSILPAPWVDNGIEIGGTQFFADETARLDYAVYAIGGPKGNQDAVDFDFIQSRSRDRYYVDNNSRPSVGGRLAGSLDIGEDLSLSLGGSVMAGHYDPDNELSYIIGGADFVLQYKQAFLRAEYLIRRTEMSLGENPAQRFKYGPGADGTFDNFFLKDGFYTELEVPVSKWSFIARWDGMRRRGNVVASSPLRSKSAILRYTGGLAYKLKQGLRIKASGEFYDFSDFQDEVAIHLGLAGPF